jgi:hypothetical protein
LLLSQLASNPTERLLKGQPASVVKMDGMTAGAAIEFLDRPYPVPNLTPGVPSDCGKETISLVRVSDCGVFTAINTRSNRSTDVSLC